MEQDYKNNLSEIFYKWKAAQAHVRIYGVQSTQAKAATVALFDALSTVLPKFKEVSIIKKEDELELVVKSELKNSPQENEPQQPAGLPINSPTTLKDFKRLKMNSISFFEGLEKEDLSKLFSGLAKSTESLEEQNGLKGFLQNQGVSFIKIDQIEYRLLREDEHITSKEADAAGGIKVFDSAWQSYLDEKIKKEDFKTHYDELIKLAKENPKELITNIKKMAKKQKQVETFLANMEQKLFDLGFPSEAIVNIKQKLTRPKKLTIREDELARLRQIEKDFQKTLDQRIEDSVKSISEVKKRLSNEKERTEAILRQISQGVMVLDRDGKILATNPIAQKVLGLSTKEAQGKQLKEIVKDHHMLSMVSDWQLEDSDNVKKEVKIQSLNNQTLDTIRESAVVIEDEDGKAIGIISTLHNVMEHQELENRKNDILDVLGHDLRAPIYAAKYNLSLLIESLGEANKPADKQQEMVKLCQKNVERMEKMVEKILDLRRLETGKVILKKEEVDLNKLIEECTSSLQGWAKDKNISLQADMQALPHISADPERLYQVITNLISNALKFTPQDGRIEVKAKNLQDGSNKFIEIAISDSGVGIEKNDLERIFNKYEQVRLKTPEGASGLGLGLAICKSIVQLHSGKIWAESELNKGSTFIFQLPVIQDNE